MTTVYTPTDDDLLVITEQVWSSFLDPDGLSPLVPVPPDEKADDVSASVSVTGSWHGHVVLTCSAGAARHAAGALLGMESDEVDDADIADALGELANVIGGNVKSLLPDPSALSLPQVITAPSGQIRWPSAAEVCRLSATWQGEPITITVLESKKDTEE